MHLVGHELTEVVQEAAETLEKSPVDLIQADAPVLEEGDVLHPLVAAIGTIEAPFTFLQLGLAVNTSDGQTFNMKLVPPGGKRIAVPIESEPAEGVELPAVGFSALRAVIQARQDSETTFTLFGEGSDGTAGPELEMPSQAATDQLVKVVAGQVIAKSIRAMRQAAKQAEADETV